MCNARRAPIKLACIFLFIGMIFVSTSALSVEKMERATAFDLVIKDNLISLNAKDASLKQIVEEMGRRMDIKVDVHIAEDEKITEQFDRLPLEDSLKRLSTNYVYLLNSEKEKGKTARIVFLKKGTTEKVKGQSIMTARESRKGMSKKSEPFKFEFDPSGHMKDEK